MYFIKDDLLYKKESNKSIITYLVGNSSRFELTNNNNIITAEYQIFDLEESKYIIDTNINKNVDIYVNNENLGQLEIIEGIGQFEFESEENGTFKIRIENREVIVNVENH